MFYFRYKKIIFLLNETVVLSAHKICFTLDIRKLFFCYTLSAKALLFPFIHDHKSGKTFTVVKIILLLKTS